MQVIGSKKYIKHLVERCNFNKMTSNISIILNMNLIIGNKSDNMCVSEKNGIDKVSKIYGLCKML